MGSSACSSEASSPCTSISSGPGIVDRQRRKGRGGQGGREGGRGGRKEDNHKKKERKTKRMHLLHVGSDSSLNEEHCCCFWGLKCDSSLHISSDRFLARSVGSQAFHQRDARSAASFSLLCRSSVASIKPTACLLAPYVVQKRLQQQSYASMPHSFPLSSLPSETTSYCISKHATHLILTPTTHTTHCTGEGQTQ